MMDDVQVTLNITTKNASYEFTNSYEIEGSPIAAAQMLFDATMRLLKLEKLDNEYARQKITDINYNFESLLNE